MITLGIIAQQAIRRLVGGNQSKDSQLDRREVVLKLRQIMNEKAKISFFENYKLGEAAIEGQYVATYLNIDIQKDTDRNEQYSEIPVSYVALPKGRGIREVSPMKGNCNPFAILQHGAKGIYRTLPAGELQGHIGCYPEGNRIYYSGNPISKGFNKVLMKLAVAAPDSLDESAPIPIDASIENQLVNELVVFFQNKVQQDKLNDNTDQ
jgi:hypothetical protein